MSSAVLVVAGFVLVVGGVAALSVPAALIVAGVLLLVAGLEMAE